MDHLTEFCGKHAHFFLKYPAHIFGVRVSCQLCDLVQLQPGACQQALDPLDPEHPHCLRKTHSRLFLKLL